MTVSQKIFALLVSVGVFLFIIDMIRRKKLREEYAMLWLMTSVLMLVLVLRYSWLVWLTDFIGARLVTSTLFIGAIIFLLLVAVQFSIKLSKLTDQLKNLSQENALLREEVGRCCAMVSKEDTECS